MNIKHNTIQGRASTGWGRAAQVLAPTALAAVLALGTGAPAQAAGKISWQTNFESAMAAAKRSGKPMFVDFYATWCGPCKALDAKVFPDARVVQAARSYVMVKVDGDKRPDLVKKYGIQGYPSLAFFSPSGKLRKVQVGAPVPKKFSGDPYKAAAVELTRLMSAFKSPQTTSAFR